MTTTPPAISVVIPARDEVMALEGLLAEVEAALAEEEYEIIVVDDGSTDGSHHLLTRLSVRNRRLRFLRHETSIGQSGSIRHGVRSARAALIVTLDGDGQNPPDQIPHLLAPFRRSERAALGLVQGQREKRQDTLAKRIGSRIGNGVRGALLRDGVRDSGCGLKAFRREAYLELPWFDHIHRFMPAMMLREGWQVETVPVTHRERQGGQSKYGNLSRALVGIPDLIGTAWLIRRAGPPRHPSNETRSAKQEAVKAIVSLGGPIGPQQSS